MALNDTFMKRPVGQPGAVLRVFDTTTKPVLVRKDRIAAWAIGILPGLYGLLRCRCRFRSVGSDANEDGTRDSASACQSEIVTQDTGDSTVPLQFRLAAPGRAPFV